MSTSTHYATSLSDEQWHVVQLLLPEPKWQPGGPGRPPLHLRRVVDGIFYVNNTGCQWRMMPRDFGSGMTLYGYFRRWRQQGVWHDILDTLRIWERREQGRKDDPSAGCVDSQSIKVTTQHQDVGFDGNKKIKGRKRHALVDPLGLLVAVVVTAANVDDRQGFITL
jgi:putative transposase